MKNILIIAVSLSLILVSCSQKGLFSKNKTPEKLYIKYELSFEETEESDENTETMRMFMDGSYMEFATDESRTFMFTKVGMFMEMSMEVDHESKVVTVLTTAFEEKSAYRGEKEETEKVDDEEDMRLIDEKKTILGHKCRKAIGTNKEGVETIYWYTDDYDAPNGISSLPNNLPGLCLSIEMKSDGEVYMSFTATEISEDVDMSNYKVVIPDGVEIQGLDEMGSTGL